MRRIPSKLSRVVLLPLAAVFLITLISLDGCAVNQATGRRQLNLISESREIAIGRDADESISSSLGLYPDSALQQYVHGLGMELASKCERPHLPWSFKVVDDPVVNAFALPGGFIYITRGILAHLSCEAELAGVVGHEIGHVTGKHSVARMSTAQIAQFGLGIGTVLEPRLEKFSQLASTGLGLLFLKFSRDDEREADELGLRYMHRINRDPREMASVMTMLDEVTKAGGGGRVPEWLATHPNPGNRRQNIQAHIDTITGDLSEALVNRDRYLAEINGIVFGENPRNGYFKENVFYHPDLRFQFSFPTGWKTLNQIQAVFGISPQENVLLQITLSQSATTTDAARRFFSQTDITVGRIESGPINGLQATWGNFSATSQEDTLVGTAWFTAYGSRVFQVLAFGTQQGWTNHRLAATASGRSFAELTDKKILAVKPLRLDIVTLKKPMTLAQFVSIYPSAVTLETLALINRVAVDTILGAGQKVKRVVGKKLP